MGGCVQLLYVLGPLLIASIAPTHLATQVPHLDGDSALLHLAHVETHLRMAGHGLY
jgi:hypothetical protein